MIVYQQAKLASASMEAVLITVLEEDAADPKNFLAESYVLVFPGSISLMAEPKKKLPRDKRPLIERLPEAVAATAATFRDWATELANARGTSSPYGPVPVDLHEPPFARILWSGKCKPQIERIAQETGSTELQKILQRALRLPLPNRPPI